MCHLPAASTLGVLNPVGSLFEFYYKPSTVRCRWPVFFPSHNVLLEILSSLSKYLPCTPVLLCRCSSSAHTVLFFPCIDGNDGIEFTSDFCIADEKDTRKIRWRKDAWLTFPVEAPTLSFFSSWFFVFSFRQRRNVRVAVNDYEKRVIWKKREPPTSAVTFWVVTYLCVLLECEHSVYANSVTWLRGVWGRCRLCMKCRGFRIANFHFIPPTWAVFVWNSM